jgi:hypothetical protein
MSFKGKLETFYFASLLQFLSHDKKTGVLELSHDVNKVKIFIKDGIIVFATSSQKERSLGHVIRTQGIIRPRTPCHSAELLNAYRLSHIKFHKARGRRLYCNTPTTDNAVKLNM